MGIMNPNSALSFSRSSKPQRVRLLAAIQPSNSFIFGAVLFWILAVGVGIKILLAYSNTPGKLSTPPSDWPASTAIQPQRNRACLLVFAHPQCPCSRATINELARIMAGSQGKVQAYVVFLAPKSAKRDWIRGNLWKAASAIPDVRVIADEDANEMRRFGASTSGQSLLYNARGHLLFNGGLTVARGHEGPNDGADAVFSFLQTGAAQRKTAPVFGCSLLDESRL